MAPSKETLNACRAYIGRQRRLVDTMAPEPALRLSVVLEADLPEKLPPTWHWAYFTQALHQTDVGPDGHEKLGLFMPPAPFSRRMWAAGHINVLRPLRLGVVAEQISTISDVAFKNGRSGPLCFVVITHEIIQSDKLAVRESQTIVYRDRGLADPVVQPSDEPAPDGYQVFPDTLLIAYSSILQNGHRIHWDREFCRNIEGYPGLVVHGPLLATILADTLVDVPEPCQFSYHAKAPVFEETAVCVKRDGRAAWIERIDGVTAMVASRE